MTRIAGKSLVYGMLVAVIGLTGCSEERLVDLQPQAAKGSGGGAGINVGAVTPSRGEQGAIDLAVTISGSGFVAGAEASWERNGAPSQKVVVTKTQYVSAKQVIATIQIALDAELALYDVAVTNPDRKKGISTESFEVSPEGVVGDLLLELAGEASTATGTNGAYTVGRIIAGGSYDAVVWTPTGRVMLGGNTGNGSTAYGINADGLIVGSAHPAAVAWRPAGAGAWLQSEPLPLPQGSWKHTVAYAVNDQGYIIGSGLRSDDIEQAIRWSPNAGGGYTVELIPLIASARRMTGDNIANVTGYVTGTFNHDVGSGFYQDDGFVWMGSGEALILPRHMADQWVHAKGINASGVVVGYTSVPNGTLPLKWEPNGNGYSMPIELPTLASVTNYPWGINDAGDIVSTSGDGVVYLCGRMIQLRSPAGLANNYGYSISADGKVAVGRVWEAAHKVKGISQAKTHAIRWDLSEFSCR